jgi:hypothetical protein
MKNACGRFTPVSTRRSFLQQSSIGFGALALADLLGRSAQAAGSAPLAPKAPHFKPRAKRVIFLFMHGGPSQVDTFDYKPILQQNHGKPLPYDKPRIFSAKTSTLLASPFSFKRYGQSGAWASELFPNVGSCADDICFVHSAFCSNSRHGGALLELHTGSDTFVRPSMGSWVGYGLGTENEDLPSYVTIRPTLTHGGVNSWSSSFLPAVYSGTPLGNTGMAIKNCAIPHIRGGGAGRKLQRFELDFLQQLNRSRLEEVGSDNDLESRIQSFELAYRMQTEAPEIQSLTGESAATRKLYGLDEKPTDDFARQCLMARRFSERGVRFVQATHSYKWDQHGNLRAGHRQNAAEVDKPIAGLLQDLKTRGLLDETLVLWSGEFGRTPVGQSGNGRDHNPHGFTVWMAGGGIRPGMSFGRTDDFGYYAIENKVHFHDLHATILHLLGIDHERLTYRYSGRDFRLTDVHGRVVHEIIA